ncbi:MAG: GTPase, partial [Acidimicrobiia bacterium]|nr:GTPase [Acidimicrobiia bacterium]
MQAVDLTSLLDLHDRLVASCVGVVADEVVDQVAQVGRAARRRAGYLADSVVVALVGGTGSGKSSLLNAIAGEEVSAAGAVRPTTSTPVAWIPANPEPGLVRMLDDLELENRVGHDRSEALAVIDLPDTDSVIAEHRDTVERLVPLVDAVVWVLDPEKYKDERLHRQLVQPLAKHASRFVFVLNQADRVGDDDVGRLIDDLNSALEADGIASPTIVATAADPPLGDPRGLEALLEAIRGLGSARSVVTRRILTQLRESADRLVEHLGGVGGTGFVARWTAARNDTAQQLAAALDAGIEEAAAAVARRDAAAIASLVGGRVPARSITAAGARIPPTASAPIRALVDETGRQLDPSGRAVLVEQGPDVETEVATIGRQLAATEEIPLPPPPTWWSRVRLLSYLLVAAALVAVVAAFDAFRADAAAALAVGAGVAAVAGLSLLRIAVARSARRRVQRALIDRRTADRASAELERRNGR